MEEAVLREVEAGVGGEGFQDDGGNVPAMEFKGFFDGFPVVVRYGDGELRHFPGNARAVRFPEGKRAGTRRDEQGVHVPVVAADEFDDFTASGIAAGQPDGGHGGFRAGVDHAHFFHGGHHADNHFRHVHLRRRGDSIAQSPVYGGMYGVQDGFRGVSQDGGAPRADVVDELAAVRIRDVGAFGGLDEEGIAVHVAEGPDGGVDAARYDGARAGEELGGLIHVAEVSKKGKPWRRVALIERGSIPEPMEI